MNASSLYRAWLDEVVALCGSGTIYHAGDPTDIRLVDGLVFVRALCDTRGSYGGRRGLRVPSDDPLEGRPFSAVPEHRSWPNDGPVQCQRCTASLAGLADAVSEGRLAVTSPEGRRDRSTVRWRWVREAQRSRLEVV